MHISGSRLGHTKKMKKKKERENFTHAKKERKKKLLDKDLCKRITMSLSGYKQS